MAEVLVELSLTGDEQSKASARSSAWVEKLDKILNFVQE